MYFYFIVRSLLALLCYYVIMGCEATTCLYTCSVYSNVVIQVYILNIHYMQATVGFVGK